MDKDQVKGKVEDIKGRIKRQTGEWTGNKEQQAEGAAQQVKGKVQNTWGKVKDAGRDATNRVTNPRSPEPASQDPHRKKDDSAA